MNIYYKEMMDCTFVQDPIANLLHFVDLMHTSMFATLDMGHTKLVTEIQNLNGALQVQGITIRRSCMSCEGNNAWEESHLQKLL